MNGITIEEVIEIYIQYNGNRQGLFTDYGSVFVSYLQKYQEELRQCSFFEKCDRENTLSIRYRNNKYVIYSTAEKAALWGIECSYDNVEQAIKKYLELYHMLIRI